MRSVDAKPTDLVEKFRKRAAERELEAASVTDESKIKYLKATAKSWHILADAFRSDDRMSDPALADLD